MTLLSGGVALVACFPQEDLSTYSAAYESLAPTGGESATSGGAGSLGGTTSAAGGDDGPSGGGDDGPSGGGAAGIDEGQGGLPSLAGAAGQGETGGAASVAPDAGDAVDSGSAEPPPEDPQTPPTQGETRCAEAGGVAFPELEICLTVSQGPALDFDAAGAACESSGASLVKVETAELDGLITEVLADANAGDAWLGLADPARNGPGANPAANDFAWPDGSDYQLEPGFDPWGPGEPDATPDQFCVEKRMQPQGPGEDPGEWFDRPCSDEKAYVCERSFASLAP